MRLRDEARLAVVFFCLAAVGCASHRERVDPRVQARIEAEHGAPLAFTPEVKTELDAWTGENVIGIDYEGTALYCTSAPLGEQAAEEAARQIMAPGGGGATGSPWSYGLLIVPATLGLWVLKKLRDRKLRAAETEAEVARLAGGGSDG